MHIDALGRSFLYAHCQLTSATMLTHCWSKGGTSSNNILNQLSLLLSVAAAGIGQIASQNIIFLFDDDVNMLAFSLVICNHVY